MFEKRRRTPDPHAEALREIDAMWNPDVGWFITAHEKVLGENPDTIYHERRRQQARAIAAARKSELIADLLARSQRR